MAVCFSIIRQFPTTENISYNPPTDRSVAKKYLMPAFVSVVFFLIFILVSTSSLAGLLMPLEGRGNFHSNFDVVNRWQDDGRLDVLVLVEVANADIKYEEVKGSFVGKLNLLISLESPDGEIIKKNKHMSTARLDPVLAASQSSYQIFGVVLEDVPFRNGRMSCRLEDALRKKQGVMSAKNLASSESVYQWSADQEYRVKGGVSVGDPLFLAHAPMKTWDPNLNPSGAKTDYLHDYIHPSRRYGLEQDKIQLFLPVWPSTGTGSKESEHTGLRVQIISSDMVYSITDTISFDARGIAALERGHSAGLLYELDLNILPEGSYRMAIAPLNKAGKGQLVMFDVIWRMSALSHSRDQVLGEGRLVLTGIQLEKFLGTTPAGQAKILEEFWTALNPDPENPVNSVYLEFLYRMEYVRNFLGGFDAYGANDPRGEVYLLLGQPDDVERKIMPMNSRDLEDAQIKTFQQFAPDREGSWAKGEDLGFRSSSGGSSYTSSQSVPMPQSSSGERQIMLNLNTSYKNHGYELWKYDSGGKPIFDNYLMNKGLWQRFLFVDRTGTGEYFLESSNILQGGD